jgi:tetratricopeptide (TPR) repeat protein
LLLDRRRIKYWQKWIYALMAVLMVAFLVYIPLGSQGCGAGTTATQAPNDRIASLKKQLTASPGVPATMLALAQAYQLAAGQQTSTSAQQRADLTNAAAYYQQYLDATKDQKTPEAIRSRIDTLQTQAAVYSNLSDYAKAVDVYKELTAMQPENAGLFAQLGQFAISANQTNIALLAFTRYLQLAPNSPDAKTIRDWVEKNSGTSASPSPSATRTASASPTASAKPTTSPAP